MTADDKIIQKANQSTACGYYYYYCQTTLTTTSGAAATYTYIDPPPRTWFAFDFQCAPTETTAMSTVGSAVGSALIPGVANVITIPVFSFDSENDYDDLTYFNV